MCALTLVHYIEGEDGAVVPSFLFGIAPITGVLACVLEGDVPQQDGDIFFVVLPHKLYSISKYLHWWFRILRGNLCFTHLQYTVGIYKGPGSCQSSNKVKKLSGDLLRHFFYLNHGPVVVELPVEVKVFYADAAFIRAGQHDSAPVHCLQEGNLPHNHLQSLNRPNI